MERRDQTVKSRNADGAQYNQRVATAEEGFVDVKRVFDLKYKKTHGVRCRAAKPSFQSSIILYIENVHRSGRIH